MCVGGGWMRCVTTEYKTRAIHFTRSPNRITYYAKKELHNRINQRHQSKIHEIKSSMKLEVMNR